MPTRDAYHDWFRFLQVGVTYLNTVNPGTGTPHIDLRNDINAALNAGQPLDEELGKWYKARNEQRCNNAMAAVLANYDAIVDYLVLNSHQPVSVERLETIRETLPRIWFNRVTDNGPFGSPVNDAALNNMMKAEFPDVDIK